MTNLDLSQAIESAAKAVWDHYWVDEQGAPADDFSNPVIGNREIFLDDATRAIGAALPHILEALAGEAEADFRELTPIRKIRADWLRAKAVEARA